MLRFGFVLCLVSFVLVVLIGGVFTYFYLPGQSAQVIMMTAVVPGCGNEIIEEGEQCDGMALQGATCESLELTQGTVRCTNSCTLDTSDCTSKDSSWFTWVRSSWWPPPFLTKLF